MKKKEKKKVLLILMVMVQGLSSGSVVTMINKHCQGKESMSNYTKR